MNEREVLSWLEANGKRSIADGMARFGITTELRVVGVSMGTMQILAKKLKKEHDSLARHSLAAGLWEAEWYESRMLAALVEDPSRVTRRQMNSWAADFDNWAICDTCCFHLFDRTPFAWEKVEQWATARREFVKRASFALLASLALHDKAAADDQFLGLLPLIEECADDERNFVKKAVNWALRGIGKRNLSLNKAAVATAKRLAESEVAAPRWVGKDALRELTRMKSRPRPAKKAK